MLTDDEKKRIEAEETYRAQMRDRLGPVKTEGFVDRYSKWSLKYGCLFIALGMLLVMGTCTMVSLGRG